MAIQGGGGGGGSGYGFAYYKQSTSLELKYILHRASTNSVYSLSVCIDNVDDPPQSGHLSICLLAICLAYG